MKRIQIMLFRNGAVRARSTFAIALMSATLYAVPSRAASECAVFTATMKVNGQMQRIFTTPTKETFTPPVGATLEVRGTYVEFDVALDNFAVSNNVLTGATAQHQITMERTALFTTKASNAGAIGGQIDLELDDSGQNLDMRRKNGEKSIRIQAKDCDQGGILQLEPEPAIFELNVLTAPFQYCYQANATSPRFFTNGVVLGYDSPQSAKVVKSARTQAQWQVQSGGRVGAVLGEDALEALQDAGSAALKACPNQTPHS